MAQDSPTKHFFISYNKADRTWAEWIAWQLEEAGYSTILQAWDFRPGSNFVLEMDKAIRLTDRTIALLSPDYLKALYTQSEWAAAFRLDPTGEDGTLVPVQVCECRHELRGLLRQIISIDLVGLDEATARKRLLEGINHERHKPMTPPLFPGSVQHSVSRPQQFPGTLPSTRDILTWNIPYNRNPFFTGREDLLEQLHTNLTRTKVATLTQPQAISGLGGIGKTQTAVEYAFLHRNDYRYILWVNAATLDSLIGSFLELATLLRLPEREEQDQNLIVAAVKAWLTDHDGWLLIFDNADDLTLVEDFLPQGAQGHLLLTTRAQAFGTLANGIEVEKMDRQEGMLLLLRRAKVLQPGDELAHAPIADRITAEAIIQELDGLPLALDQAGAYIEETQCAIASYLEQYRKQHAKLLKRRGGTGKQHPDPVATTWKLSFEQVETLDPIAADLLRCCAFLAPDAIVEQLIIDGASQLGPLLQPLAEDPSLLDEAIAALLRFSLVKRKRDEHTLSVHRLVQTILRTGMDAQTQQQWTERTVRAVNKSFPDVKDYRNWALHRQFLPHAQTCFALIDQWEFEFSEAGRLSNQVGYYLYEHARYVEAEACFQRAIAIDEKTLGSEHPTLATDLNNLANLYDDQGKYEEAELLYQRAIAIGEKTLGPEHPDLATWLNNLALLYWRQGKYEEAEPLYQRAIAIDEKALGPEHPDLATDLNNLANLYLQEGKYEEAEPLYQRVLAILEKTLGPEHPNFASLLSNLGSLYLQQGKYEEAEPLFQRAIAIDEKVLGPEHPHLATWLNNLANLYLDQGKYEEAEPLYQRAIAMNEKVLGPEHPNSILFRKNYAVFLRRRNEER